MTFPPPIDLIWCPANVKLGATPTFGGWLTGPDLLSALFTTTSAPSAVIQVVLVWRGVKI